MIWHKDCTVQRTVKKTTTCTQWILSAVATLYCWIYSRALDWDQVQMKLFACNERARAIPVRQRSRLFDIIRILPLMRDAGWMDSSLIASARRFRWIKQTNEALQTVSSEHNEQTLVFWRLTLYFTTMFGSYAAFCYAFCLATYTFFTTLWESKFDVKTWMSHFCTYFFTISTCGMFFLGGIPHERSGRRPGEEIMIHTNCMKNFLVLKWMINPTNGFSSQF